MSQDYAALVAERADWGKKKGIAGEQQLLCQRFRIPLNFLSDSFLHFASCIIASKVVVALFLSFLVHTAIIMHCFSERRCMSFAAVASIFFALLAVLPDAAVAADSGSPDTVNWTWPLVNVGPQAVDTVHTYNTVDTLNASWTSNLNYNPFLVVWCQAPGGYTASTHFPESPLSYPTTPFYSVSLCVLRDPSI